MSRNRRSPGPTPPPAKRSRTFVLGTSNSFEDSYLDEELADVYFVFGSADSHSASSSTRIPAHKFTLARNSAVFKAMLYGPMKETGDIHLTDVSEAAFKEFLQFFYLTKAELSIENLVDVMHLGHKYMVTKCVNYGFKFFKEVHSAENIWIGLELGILYGNLELMTLCERLIAANTKAILKLDGFLKCDQKLLTHILNANLFVCSEVELFEACMAWVAARGGHDGLTKKAVDEHLGELFYNIRFGTMTINEICILSDKYEAVLSDDYKAITKLIGQPELQQDRFNTQSRQIKWSDPNAAVIKCNREYDNIQFHEWTKTNRCETITLSANKKLLLTGFTINKIASENNGDLDDDDDNNDGDGNAETKLPIKIKVFEINSVAAEREVVLEMSADIVLKKITKISLTKPVSIGVSDMFNYEISIEIPCQFDSAFSFHSKALMEHVKLDCGGIVEFHQCKASQGSQSRQGRYSRLRGRQVIGIISALEFNRI